MSTKTTNYGFVKPTYNEAADIEVINQNMDSIDTAMKSIDQKKPSFDVATQSADGLLSKSDKAKLDGIAANANAYVHPTGDGNLHVPAVGTTNAGKVLKAGSTPGSVGWGNLTNSDVGLDRVENKSAADILTNPALSGNATAPTPVASENSTKIATTAYVQNQGYLTRNAVTSVAGKTGAVYLNQNDVSGLVKESGDVMQGALAAYSDRNYSTRELRNIVLWDGVGDQPMILDGELLFIYEI